MSHSVQPALLTIDMQNAFFTAGPLAHVRDDLVSRCNALRAWAVAHDVPVLLVRTEHQPDRSTWTLNMLEDGTGFLFAGEEDAAGLPGLVTEGAVEVVKTRDSAFHATRLPGLLEERDVGLLLLAGVSSHTCVATTAADAYAHDRDVVFVDDAIASHRPELHEGALATLCDEFRFRRIATADVVASTDPTRDLCRVLPRR